MRPGSYMTLRNAKIDMLRGNMRLAVGLGGKIDQAPGGTAFEPKARRRTRTHATLRTCVTPPCAAAAPVTQFASWLLLLPAG